jgi:WD40 repeat protein
MTWKLLTTLKRHSNTVYSVSWNHDGGQIVSGSADKTIKIWDSSTGRVIKTLTGHSDWVYSVSWSHDDRKIVSCSKDKTVRIWNAVTGDLVKTLMGHSEIVNCVAWSPDDRTIASCSQNEKKITIWDALIGQEMNTIQPTESRLVAWNRDDSELACNDDRKIKVISFRN